MKLISSVTQLLVILAMSHFGTAAPSPHLRSVTNELTARQSGDLIVCIDGLGDPGCIDLQVTDRNCIDFDGHLSPWNDAISNTIIPGGFVCFFAPRFGCDAGDPGSDPDTPGLPAGTWDLGSLGFNDQASSVLCFAG
ncbi:hypothetical protein B0H14DRAFT_2974665 [Mycena olivaceomarginata]|nr:hypothetical protein B0H14DRAFT_2974665 [Mycena olivaceomarginata]